MVSVTDLVLLVFKQMRALLITGVVLVLCACAYPQSDLQQLYEAERKFDQAIREKGVKPAFLDFLASDAVLFRPTPVNGKKFWEERADSSTEILLRSPTFADLSTNGSLGYTTGNWEYHPNGMKDSRAEYGQFVTIWEKRPGVGFRMTLDMVITHEKLPPKETNRSTKLERTREINKYGWSVADASMNFLKMSMGKYALGGAYKRFAGDDVRLLRDSIPPILGKKNVVSQTKQYLSIDFPQKVSLLESANMAYVWNQCEFANSNEGFEKGNCLQIWKLRDKKWWIVLGAFARLPNDSKPELKSRANGKTAK